MASPLFLGVNGTSHALGMSTEQMADNIRVVKSRRINCCYVGRFRPHGVVSELPRLACILFYSCRFARSAINVAITFLVDDSITFLVYGAYCTVTLATTCFWFGIYLYFRSLLLRFKRDRLLQAGKGVIVAVVVILVKSVDLSRKRLDERQIADIRYVLKLSRSQPCAFPMPPW